MTDKPQSDPTSPKTLPCSVCGFQNPAGILICENCGAQLVKGVRSNVDTRTFITPSKDEANDEKPVVDPSPTPAVRPVDLLGMTKATTHPLSDDGDKRDNAAAQGQVCPNCKHVNRAGVLLCENCGTNLRTGEKPRIGTANFAPPPETDKEHETLQPGKNDPPKQSPGAAASLSTEEVKAIQTAGAAVFEDSMVLRLEVEGAPTPILVYPTAETIIGRRDPVTNSIPDIDLTAYAGYRMGVSRQHAVLSLHDRVLDVRDLGSSNGTFVNGVRLSPHQPHSLRDGDELALGKMTLRVFFQSGMRS